MNIREQDKLVRQATIVSGMMLALARAFHGDYRRKHVGAVWEELLVAFALWEADTTARPLTVLGIAKSLGIPRTNVNRAIVALVHQGLAAKVNRRYGRNVGFIAAVPTTEHFRTIRETVMKAGRELEGVWR